MFHLLSFLENVTHKSAQNFLIRNITHTVCVGMMEVKWRREGKGTILGIAMNLDFANSISGKILTIASA
jgi:hypothetical protein